MPHAIMRNSYQSLLINDSSILQIKSHASDFSDIKSPAIEINPQKL